MKNKLIHKVVALLFALVATVAMGTVSAFASKAGDIESLVNSISGVQGQFNDALVNVPNTITGTVSNLQGQFNDAFVNAPNTVTGTVSNLQGQFNDAFVNTPNTIAGTVDTVANTGSTVQSGI